MNDILVGVISVLGGYVLGALARVWWEMHRRNR